jgi:hypothetical protein
MTLYILTGLFDYEGEMVLGVYLSREEAEAHKKEFIEREGETIFDDFDIKVKVLNEPASMN